MSFLEGEERRAVGGLVDMPNLAANAFCNVDCHVSLSSADWAWSVTVSCVPKKAQEHDGGDLKGGDIEGGRRVEG